MLKEKLKNKKIILGSSSPRRKELLKFLDIIFEVRLSDFDENYPANLEVKEVAEFLATKKNKELSKTLKKEEILITADTIVSKSGKILNKPKDKKQAIQMLELLSGDKHEVITAVCISNKKKKVVFSCTTDVYFKHLMLEEIIFYVNKYQPFDKAGAYGIQEWIGLIGINAINGSYYNVVGLPITRLYQELVQFIK
ncbi:uncharacterized protein METZ01_LOCUS335807 [marine metagenome]|uniref:Septum formation protein Maf n=1 Tax=marine metagenome TaxID=408172 RepID=A0A382QBN6_9ZZZZ